LFCQRPEAGLRAVFAQAIDIRGSNSTAIIRQDIVYIGFIVIFAGIL
jgi:hypothetical protein